MNKETLIKLATPASIVLLSLSIFSIPRTTKADITSYGVGEKYSRPIYVQITNPYSIGN